MTTRRRDRAGHGALIQAEHPVVVVDDVPASCEMLLTDIRTRLNERQKAHYEGVFRKDTP